MSEDEEAAFRDAEAAIKAERLGPTRAYLDTMRRLRSVAADKQAASDQRDNARQLAEALSRRLLAELRLH